VIGHCAVKGLKIIWQPAAGNLPPISHTDCLDKPAKPMRLYEQFQAHISAPLIPDEAVYGSKDQKPHVSKKRMVFVGLYQRIGQWVEEYYEEKNVWS